ncbi:MAG: four helix bundle protein [Gammaproteobacteria bacterium]|nr:four helix bundle protein [Gammaproteobacteria bacterium]
MDALEELEVWCRSKNLAIAIYKTMDTCKDHGFKDQITRASVSIPSNIAEGYERYSKKEFANYLRIAKGSCAEVRTQLQIGHDIGFIDSVTAKELIKESLEISKMLHGLIKYCKERAPM